MRSRGRDRQNLFVTMAAAIAVTAGVAGAIATGVATAQAPSSVATTQTSPSGTANAIPPTRAVIVPAPVATAPPLDGAATPGRFADSPAAPTTLDGGFRFNTLAVLLHSARPYDPRLRIDVTTSLDGSVWEPWATVPFTRSEGRPGTARHPDDTASQPLWIGAARFVRYRITLAGEPATPVAIDRLRFVFIDTVDEDATGDGVLSTGPQFDLRSTATRTPAMVTRAGWGANESWRRWRPEYARVRMAFVHHTAGTTEYTREQSPAIVRAVYYYHCRVLGWGDIGYNFLVDRYGTIYVGRYGGVRRGVIGAQVAGFNTNSTGISMIGTFETAQPTPAMLAALERLLAWKLSLTRVDPLGHTTMTSHGGDRYAPGVRVRLRTISAHRDVGATACPGTAAYARMAQIRLSTAAHMRGRTPPVYVWASATPGKITPNGDGVNDSATLSCYVYSPADVRVTVLDAAGNEVRLLQDWAPLKTGIWPVVWDGTLPGSGGPVAISGVFTLRVEARDVLGRTKAAVAKVAVNATVSHVTLTPVWFSPNGDGVADVTTLAYTLDRDATPVVSFGPASAPWRTVDLGRQGAGARAFVWDGRADDGAAVPDGTVRVEILATDDSGVATVIKSVSIDRVRPRPIAVKPSLAVKRGVRIDVPYRVTDRSTTTVRTRIVVTDADGTVVKDSDRGWVTTGALHELPFKSATAGAYTFTITAYDHAGNHEVAPAVVKLTVR